jgi:thiamine transport system ATP-binding protein
VVSDDRVARLVASAVTVRFGDRTVLDAVDLTVGAGEIVALLGPSGSGKSTLLRVIAGLLPPDAGRIVIDGTDVTRVATHRRGVGMVFQDEQLFPHRTVGANVGFGLRMQGVSKAAIAARVGELLELVGLVGYGDRDVASLSGGEAKRVALARSLAPRPSVLLLDEPLTGLDADLHDRLVADIGSVLRATATTALHVTHDRAEADALADRVMHIGDLAT